MVSLLQYSPRAQHDEFILFPSPTSKYPVTRLFPSEFVSLRNAKFQALRNDLLPQLTPKNVQAWYQQNGKEFDLFLKLWTDFVWTVMASEAGTSSTNFCQPLPNAFEWHSSFDTKKHSSPCLLYETIMLWHVKALIHYHLALDLETVLKNGTDSEVILKNVALAQVEMCKALDIWTYICRMFIKAWRTKAEMFLPWECIDEGNGFFVRLATMKLEFYELFTVLQKNTHILGRFEEQYSRVVSFDPMVATDCIISKASYAQRVCYLCMHLAYSSSRVSWFLQLLRASHQIHGFFSEAEHEKSLLLNEMIHLQFTDYETLATLIYLRFAMNHITITADVYTPIVYEMGSSLIESFTGGSGDTTSAEFTKQRNARRLDRKNNIANTPSIIERLTSGIISHKHSRLVRILLEETALLFLSEADSSLTPSRTLIKVSEKLLFLQKGVWTLFPTAHTDEGIAYDGFLEASVTKQWYQVFEEFLFLS